MKSIYIKIIGVLFIVNIGRSKAQTTLNSPDDVCHFQSLDLKNNNTKNLDSLLASGKFDEGSVKMLKGIKARVLFYQNTEIIKKEAINQIDEGRSMVLNSIIDLYNPIITDTNHAYRLDFLLAKYTQFRNEAVAYDRMDIDSSYLRSLGFKNDRRGIAIGVIGTVNEKNILYGLELNISNFVKFSHKTDMMKDIRTIKSTPTFIGSFLNFTYLRNFSNKEISHDIHFSFVKIVQPIYFDPFLFGFYKTNGYNQAYYRPTIGLGKSNFFANYGYNVFLNKVKNSPINKSQFTLGYKFTLK